MNIRSLAAGLVLVAALAPPALAYDAQAVAEAKESLQTAVNAGSVPDMLAARAKFETMSNAEPKDALLHYWVAVCDWRVTPHFLGKNPDKAQAKRWCEDGIAHAQQAVKLDSKFAEAIALRVGLTGLSFQYDPGRAMTQGMGLDSDLARARDLAPKNPRVALLDAINTQFKPGFVGGGADKALPKYGQAQKLFADERVTDPAAPDWGKDDAYLWAGRAASQNGDDQAARAYYQKALEANPDNGWVKTSLLPAVEKKLGAKTES